MIFPAKAMFETTWQDINKWTFCCFCCCFFPCRSNYISEDIHFRAKVTNWYGDTFLIHNIQKGLFEIFIQIDSWKYRQSLLGGVQRSPMKHFTRSWSVLAIRTHFNSIFSNNTLGFYIYTIYRYIKFTYTIE